MSITSKENTFIMKVWGETIENELRSFDYEGNISIFITMPKETVTRELDSLFQKLAMSYPNDFFLNFGTQSLVLPDSYEPVAIESIDLIDPRLSALYTINRQHED